MGHVFQLFSGKSLGGAFARSRRRGASTRPHSSRRAVETLELILITPIIVILLLAIFEWMTAMLTYQTVVSAAAAGSRIAAKGGTMEEVVAKINQYLSPQCLVIDMTADSQGDVVLEDSSRFLVPQDYNPFHSCDPPAVPLEGEHVRVTLCLKLTGPNCRPVPDWLAACGFPWQGRCFEVSSISRREGL